MMTRARVASFGLSLLLLTVSGAQPSAQQPPSAQTLLSRAGEYVLDFVTQFSNVVADEQYVQTWRGFRHQLNGEFLLIQPQDSPGFFAFRDVFKADGVTVRDRDQRLMKLLLQPSGSTLNRAQEINQEGARYTFGAVFNSPVVVIAFVQPGYQPRFRFSLTGSSKVDGVDVYEVAFTEQTRPSVLRGRNDTDMPAAGRVWIEGDTGRIVKTELTLANDSIVTTFKYDERFKIDVPVEMTDRYRYMGNAVNGTATYGRFRRFGVSTEEQVDPADKPDASGKPDAGGK